MPGRPSTAGQSGSAGALASPHLLLASGLARRNPGGGVVGRYLMRHCNAFVYAFFPRAPNPEALHHKQIAIHDYYLGDDAPDAPQGKLGNIQQVMHPQLGGILRAPARMLNALGPFGRTVERGLTAAVAPAAGADVAAVFLDVVADKTGYPKEALALTMSLEADLGIDSIKRVEILGAVRQRLPALPEVDAMQLAQDRKSVV